MKRLAALLLMAACAACNPFAPKLSDSLPSSQFGDPHTVDGYFQAFKYAYEFRDTTVYGALLAPSFIFSFRDYDQGVDIQWGRDDEMRVTASLFAATQQLSLLWGDVLDAEGSTNDSTVTRVFSLDVTFNADDIEHVDGRAVFHLQRSAASAPWQAVSWQDESNL